LPSSLQADELFGLAFTVLDLKLPVIYISMADRTIKLTGFKNIVLPAGISL